MPRSHRLMMRPLSFTKGTLTVCFSIIEINFLMVSMGQVKNRLSLKALAFNLFLINESMLLAWLLPYSLTILTASDNFTQFIPPVYESAHASPGFDSTGLFSVNSMIVLPFATLSKYK